MCHRSERIHKTTYILHLKCHAFALQFIHILYILLCPFIMIYILLGYAFGFFSLSLSLSCVRVTTISILSVWTGLWTWWLHTIHSNPNSNNIVYRNKVRKVTATAVLRRYVTKYTRKAVICQDVFHKKKLQKSYVERIARQPVKRTKPCSTLRMDMFLFQALAAILFISFDIC